MSNDFLKLNYKLSQLYARECFSGPMYLCTLTINVTPINTTLCISEKRIKLRVPEEL